MWSSFKMFVALIFLLVPLCPRGAAVNSKTFASEESSVPSECVKVAKAGDHVLLTFSSIFGNGSQGPSHPLYVQPLHAVLDLQSELPLHDAIVGMCENGTRTLKWSSLSLVHDVPLHPIVGIKKYLPLDRSADQSFSLDIHVEHITEPTEYEIFESLRKENISHVLDLIDEHKGINAMDEYGQTPLMLAVSKQYTVVVASLLNARMPKVDVNMAKTSGFTAVFYAVESATPSILLALLRRGANPNAHVLQEGSRGNTPLHYACLLEKTKHIEILLEHGADPTAQNQHHQTPLQLLPNDAVRSTKVKLLQLFQAAADKKRDREDVHADGAGAGVASKFDSPQDL